MLRPHPHSGASRSTSGAVRSTATGASSPLSAGPLARPAAKRTLREHFIPECRARRNRADDARRTHRRVPAVAIRAWLVHICAGPPGAVRPSLPHHFRLRTLHEQIHQRPRRPRAQPEERRRGSAARPADRDHRPVRIGQVVAGVRHHLRRGAAPLCGEPVGLRPAVPGTDAEARRRIDRGAVARHLDRAEDDVEEPALHRGHGDRDLRLHAPLVGARRHPVFAGHRPADRKPDGQPDGGPHPGDGGGHAPPAARPLRARPQGRVQEGDPGPAQARLPARAGRRRDVRDRRGPSAQQEAEARHRGGRRPHRGAGRAGQPPGRFTGDGAGAGRRHRLRGERRHARTDGVLAEVRLPRLRLHDPGDRAAAVLLQQPVRRLPGWAPRSTSTRCWWSRTNA